MNKEAWSPLRILSLQSSIRGWTTSHFVEGFLPCEGSRTGSALRSLPAWRCRASAILVLTP